MKIIIYILKLTVNTCRKKKEHLHQNLREQVTIWKFGISMCAPRVRYLSPWLTAQPGTKFPQKGSIGGDITFFMNVTFETSRVGNNH